MDALNSLHNLDLNRFYCIYNTIHEMLKDRGYTPLEPKLNKKALTGHYLGYLFELESNNTDIFGIIDNMSLLFTRKKKQLLVYFYPLDSKLCQNDMTYIHKLMGDKNAQQLIIVVNNKATPKVSSVLDILGNKAQLFSEDRLTLNVTKHQIVPKHRRISTKEKTQLFNQFTKLDDGKLHPEFLPGLFTTDPIAKYYNYNVGDVIEITRPRKDGFNDISYRIVIRSMIDNEKK